MLAKYYVVEYAAGTEHIANRLRFCCHVLDVYDLRSHIARSTATDKQIIGIISYSCQAEIDYDGLLAENDIVWLEVTMNVLHLMD